MLSRVGLLSISKIAALRGWSTRYSYLGFIAIALKEIMLMVTH